MTKDDAVHQRPILSLTPSGSLRARLAHLLYNDLTGGLRRDPAKTVEIDLQRHFTVQSASGKSAWASSSVILLRRTTQPRPFVGY